MPDGTHIEKVRIKEGSQVINWMNLMDVSARYHLSDRSSISVSVPYLMAERSQPITGPRDPVTGLRPILERYRTHSAGLSDITVSYKRWMLNPETHENGNFSLGLGVKLPTGEQSVHDSFLVRNATTGEYTREVRPVDQSIQPGDGGFGFILDGAGFLRLGSGNVGLYASGTYLANPRETNEINRGQAVGSINEHYSVSDQYIARFGISAKVMEHVAANLGMRLEGVPSSDLFGGDRGFRRPGRAWSIEPALTWSGGNNSLSVGVPFAIYRNRQANLNDNVNNDGEPGDAAFADWLLMVSFGHHFD